MGAWVSLRNGGGDARRDPSVALPQKSIFDGEAWRKGAPVSPCPVCDVLHTERGLRHRRGPGSWVIRPARYRLSHRYLTGFTGVAPLRSAAMLNGMPGGRRPPRVRGRPWALVALGSPKRGPSPTGGLSVVPALPEPQFGSNPMSRPPRARGPFSFFSPFASSLSELLRA